MHFFGAQSPIKGEEIDFSRGIHAKKVEMEVRVEMEVKVGWG